MYSGAVGAMFHSVSVLWIMNCSSLSATGDPEASGQDGFIYFWGFQRTTQEGPPVLAVGLPEKNFYLRTFTVTRTSNMYAIMPFLLHLILLPGPSFPNDCS